MKYWFCITNEENWEVVKKRKIWGIIERYQNQAGKVEAHDLLTFYVKPKRIGGIFKTVSTIFKSNERIFDTVGFAKKEIFPYRLRLEPILVPKKLVEFPPLITKLDFIKRKDNKWGGSIFGKTMRQISKNDYELIFHELKKFE